MLVALCACPSGSDEHDSGDVMDAGAADDAGNPRDLGAASDADLDDDTGTMADLGNTDATLSPDAGTLGDAGQPLDATDIEDGGSQDDAGQVSDAEPQADALGPFDADENDGMPRDSGELGILDGAPMDAKEPFDSGAEGDVGGAQDAIALLDSGDDASIMDDGGQDAGDAHDVGLPLDTGVACTEAVAPVAIYNGTATGPYGDARLSEDGRYVTIIESIPLVPGDNNNAIDNHLVDRQLGTTERLSVSTLGVESIYSTQVALGGAMVSADGRIVVFASSASNLIDGLTAMGSVNLYVRDRLAQTTTQLSPPASGAFPSQALDPVGMRPDGSTVYFLSRATNLVASDFDPQQKLFVRDRAAGTTSIFQALPGTNLHPSSAGLFHGRFLALVTRDVLDPSDSGTGLDGYLIDLDAPAVITILPRVVGQLSAATDVSPDGRFVLLTTYGALIPGDTNPFSDAFLWDRANGSLERVSSGGAGLEGNGDTFQALFTDVPNTIVFLSEANNLVPGDLNGAPDLFIKDRGTDTTRIWSGPGGPPVSGIDALLGVSPTSGEIVFSSTSNGLPNAPANARATYLARVCP